MKHTLPSTSYKTPFINRILALSLTFAVLLPSITPYNNLWANNNGPNAPEAASFEPVDATDMVNLLTGDFTYVLPLMNVPSPEGGYPIALAYHAGIAMDQESSWLGLGWNLNPGAINRSVNGYPDDYDQTEVTEYFYDDGKKDTVRSFSIGYGAPGFSVGLGYSWSSNQSLGGGLSAGISFAGVSFSASGNGASVGYNIAAGLGADAGGSLTLGISISSDGSVGVNAGLIFDSNGIGFNIGASTNANYSVNFQTGVMGNNETNLSLGINFSSNGTSFGVGVRNLKGSQGISIGSHNSFNNTINQGHYSTQHFGYTIPLIVPTPIGVFSFSYGEQTVNYWSATKKRTDVTGPLDFSNITSNIKFIYTIYHHGGREEIREFASYEEAESSRTDFKKSLSTTNCLDSSTKCTQYTYVKRILFSEAYMDIYEVPLTENNDFSEEFNIEYNNPVFPAYDSYNVQAQGLSGSIHAKIIDNGALFGYNYGLKTDDSFKISYQFDGESDSLPDHVKFTNKPYFYFDNEIATYLAAVDVKFTDMTTALASSTIDKLHSSLSESDAFVSQQKKSNYIEYFTNSEISDINIFNRGFLNTNSSGFNRDLAPRSGIGAYKITAADGKTYHYSLPVYNHERVTRMYGMSISGNSGEQYAYREKRQLEPYATHWLLTAVTGPDFVDNGDRTAGDGDLGYWVSFDYGLWSDAYVWSGHPYEDYIQQNESSSIKTWVKGRKQMYFLDQIKTRTHTALFVKSEDQSGYSLPWSYRSVAHNETEQKAANFNSSAGLRFEIPVHNRLKLDRILLLKNEDVIINKTNGNQTGGSEDIWFNDSNKESQTAFYAVGNNVIDNNDNWESLRSKSLKEIEFNTTKDLSNGLLTLKNVNFKGKGGVSVMPKYFFQYNRKSNYDFDIDDRNEYGYFDLDPSAWSLNKIITPQGGEIHIDYEPHVFKTLTKHKVAMSYDSNDVGQTIAGRYAFRIEGSYNFKVGQSMDLYVNYINNINQIYDGNDQHQREEWEYDKYYFYGKTTIADTYFENGYTVVIASKIVSPDYIREYRNSRISSPNKTSAVVYTNLDIPYQIGGSRVKSIKTTDGVYTKTSSYKYGENANGIGWVTYLPYAPNIAEDIPYSTELPSSRPMYEYVEHEILSSDNQTLGSTLYHFNIINSKEDGKAKYDDFYEVKVDRDDYDDSNSSKEISIAEYTIADNLNAIGQLLSVSNYNKAGQLLNKVTNNYYSPSEIPNNIGVVKESFQSYKKATKSGKEKWMVNTSTRIKYSNLLRSSTELKNGVTYTTIFNDFDLTSGQAKQTHSYSSTGLALKTQSIPAFYKYPVMGSKVDNINNKNMLSQGAQSLSYFKSLTDTNWQLTGVDIQTWKNWGNNVWRKHKNYVWKGDLVDNGSFSMVDYEAFDWSGNTQDEGWQKISEITKYSDYSRPLETMDINGNKAASKLGDNYSKVFATSNAAYTDFTFASFENEEDFQSNSIDRTLGVSIGNNEITSLYAHSGNNSIKGAPNVATIAVNNLTTGKYKASVWVHKSNFENTVITTTQGNIAYHDREIIKAGNWVMLNFYVELTNGNSVTLKSTSGTAYFDDFRIHPVESFMTSYVYNERDELECILGPNNMGVKYEYDAGGRLSKTYTEAIENSNNNGGFILSTENQIFYSNN